MEQKILKKSWPNRARTLEPSLLSHFIAEKALGKSCFVYFAVSLLYFAVSLLYFAVS